MGFEVTRFTHEIDEEFYCSICAMILEDAMQSPCEHLYCSECIKRWLAVHQSCPVERGPLQLDHLKKPMRTVRNIMKKFEIKCDFESKGCVAMVKLEYLQDHVGRCEYNGNATVVCDKGCNVKMRRDDYEMNSCVRHLADQAVRQQENFSREMSRQNDKVKNQSKEIQRLQDELHLRGDTISRLNNDLNKLRRQFDQFPPQFRVWENMKIYMDEPNVLQVYNGRGYAQSVLEHTKFSCQIESLNPDRDDCIGIGLAPMCPSHHKPSFSDGSIFYMNIGLFAIDGKLEYPVQEWNVGDIIECRYNFPSDSVNDGRHVQVYFKRNGEVILQKLVPMPIDGLFPTVCTAKGFKIKYSSN